MKIALIVLVYCVVSLLVQFCLTLGGGLVGLPVALLLARAPERLRVFVSGIVSGIAGVIAAVAFGYWAFFIILGPQSYGLLPFLASTVPLMVPILNDRAMARQLSILEHDMSPELRAATAPPTLATHYGVIGYYIGLSLAVWWFIVTYANTAFNKWLVLWEGPTTQMTQTQVDLIVGLFWLVAIVVCFLKQKQFIAFASMLAMIVGLFPIAGMYWHHIITEPLIWSPLIAAPRLARPSSWWSNRYYSRNPSKFCRAVIRFGMVKEYVEDRRKELSPDELESCLDYLKLIAAPNVAASRYVGAAITEALQHRAASPMEHTATLGDHFGPIDARGMRKEEEVRCYRCGKDIRSGNTLCSDCGESL